ncbi:MAG: outer membrane protein transport protein [Candidatus Sabulitectum sp.]|nr:outer membrane protein transport protein [Candidatus Sabulitectum sp.]
MKRSLNFAVVLMVCALFAGSALATNGMNMIGYSVRSSGMGGADAAVDGSFAGVAGNPATMGKVADQGIAVGVSILMPKLNVSNDAMGMGLDLDGEDQIFPLPYLAYTQRLGADSPWVLGLEAYAQGGMGVEFLNFPTSATTSDKISSNVMFMRLTGAASYQVNEKLTLGLSAIGGYAKMDFAMFPGGPGGMDVTDMTDMGFAGRFGLQFKVCDRMTLGAVYTSEASLDLSGGNAAINFGPEMGGVIDYAAEMKDFAWPQEAEFGIAFQPTSDLLIAVDTKWIDWESSMDVVTLEVSDPPTGYPSAPFPDGLGGYTNAMPFQMKWESQMVYALGVEYSINEMNTVRTGFNYGKNPVPDNYLSPLFPAIVETHVTLGYGLDLGNLGFDLAYELGLDNTQTNNNENAMVNPFGPGTTVSHSQNTIHFETAYSF